MNLQTLKDEIINDPLARYNALTDEQIAASLNTVDRTKNRSSVTGDEAFGATDSTEFAGLTDHKQQIWLAFCGRTSIDPFQGSNVALVQWVFGGGSTTISNLNSIRVESASRAAELGLPFVHPINVTEAKAL